MYHPRGETTDETGLQIVMWRTVATGQSRWTMRQTNRDKQHTSHVWLQQRVVRAVDLRVERLADIEEARLCGKSRRVAFIYELRIERL